jgi:hypothetical protein
MANIDPLPLILALWSSLLTVFSAGIGWLVNRIFKMLDHLHAEHSAIRQELHGAFIRRDDYMQQNKTISEQLNRIEHKLDRKVDK